MVRHSLSLALVALWVHFAYGFSRCLVPCRLSATGSRVGHSSFSSRTTKMDHTPSRRVTTPFSVAMVPRGGGKSTSTTELQASAKAPESKCPVTGGAAIIASLWGTGGFLYILAKAIRRVAPIALEPFQSGATPLSQFELGAYIVTCLWFAYVEGYKGFQKKFSPLVVKRSFTLIPGQNGTAWYHFVLAPFYSMGLMHATRKRQTVSWAVSLGVAAVVAAVKRFPYPWRNIVDAGVVVGLTWGSLSILALYVKAWITGEAPRGVDAALPESAKQ